MLFAPAPIKCMCYLRVWNFVWCEWRIGSNVFGLHKISVLFRWVNDDIVILLSICFVCMLMLAVVRLNAHFCRISYRNQWEGYNRRNNYWWLSHGVAYSTGIEPQARFVAVNTCKILYRIVFVWPINALPLTYPLLVYTKFQNKKN